MDNLLLQRIFHFFEDKMYITSAYLGRELSLSSKTVMKIIRDINDITRREGAYFESNPGKGIRLVIEDREKFDTFLTRLSEEPVIPQTQDGRVRYLLTRLIASENAIPIDELADTLFVSRQTVQNDLKVVRDHLKSFNLNLKTIRLKGLIVEGNEFDKRRCLAHTNELPYYEELSIFSPHNEILKKIEKIVSEVLSHFRFKMTDIGFRNLIIHLFIAIKRIENGRFAQNIESQEASFSNEIEKIALEISQAIQAEFSIEMPDEELFFIALHLDSKRLLQKVNGLSGSTIVPDYLYTLVEEMISTVDETYGQHFSDDFDLRVNLSLHLVPLMTRIKYNMFLDNPLFSEIRQRMALSYLMAETATKILENTFNQKIPEQEISYIALHFNLSLQRSREQIRKKNILVVCGSGIGSSELVAYNFRKRFDDYLDKVEVTDIFGIKDQDLSVFDFVISTLNTPLDLSIPVLQVGIFLDDTDMETVEAFLKDHGQPTVRNYFDQSLFISNLEANNKQEALEQIVATVGQQEDIPDNFLELVLNREKAGFTDLESGVAIPHPMELVSDRTFIYVAILEKPIRWNRNDVSLVILLSLKKNHKDNLQDFYRSMSRFLVNKEAVDDVVESRNLQSLINYLT
ncbi:BglG family transcription antiterminator [Streptococcus merionis]|uniref:Transcriptional regulator n=1 Tax=Streptococcus merionis TaxID=400065 RepID=A0A239SWE7_9STRE|nr:BglG family transcription antiterminator [Streptococcus merionis]SNU89757.1 transcriptional regulator [Streptococcus merionis]